MWEYESSQCMGLSYIPGVMMGISPIRSSTVVLTRQSVKYDTFGLHTPHSVVNLSFILCPKEAKEAVLTGSTPELCCHVHPANLIQL